MMRSSRTKFYSDPAPGDLPLIPNNQTRTWLKDAVLILIFMEIIPDITAFLIFLMFITVMSIGISLLIKQIKLMYSRRVKLKPLMMRRRRRIKRRRQKIIDQEKNHGINSSETDSSLSPPPKRPIKKTRPVEDNVSRSTGTRHSHHSHRGVDLKAGGKGLTRKSGDDNEVGILTGTKRKAPVKPKHHHGGIQDGGNVAKTTPHMPKFLQRVHRTFVRHESK